MSRTLLVAGVAATAAGGYAIAYWLSSMTAWAERRDRERYLPPKDLPVTRKLIA
jgi:hypothetical protein